MRATYFSENQTGSVSPHEEMAPDQSAKIIIDHVAEGIEMAKKAKGFTDRIIDFYKDSPWGFLGLLFL